VVTISICLLFVAAAYPLIGQTASADSISSEGDRVKTFIERAKSLAQNPENENAVGYRVSVDSSGKFLTLGRVVLRSGVEQIEEIDQSDRLDLLNGITAQSLPVLCNAAATPGLSGSISFYAPTGEQKCQYDKSLQGQITVTLKNSDDSMRKNIKVTRGVITVN
jgi:hypothetical protein